MTNVISILESRGLLDDVTSPDIRDKVEQPLTVYAGFDPTSNSLQVGNLVTIMMLAHFQRCGHKVIALVGGATGQIGDPSGKSAERQLLGVEDIRRNAEGIRENLSRFLDFDHPTAPAIILNNLDWIGQFSFIDFLRDVGKHFRMGTMLGKESVRARLDSEAGMSFCEFSYQLLQAYDFLHLYTEHDCTIQIGGSDQWGNITAGIDLVHRLRSGQTYGVTSPLVTDSSGAKLGKSEGHALYLSADKTPVYQFYQYFVRIDDADVIRLLNIFTFLDPSEIAELEKSLAQEPEKREAQKRLAAEITRMVHGEDGLRIAQKATEVLFGGSLEGCSADDLMTIFADVPSADLTRAEVNGANVVDVVAASGLCSSKGEARRLIQNGGLYVNNQRIEDPAKAVEQDDLVDDRVLILRSGKKKYCLVRIAD
jgi:tyrosyl-tRNA synthetase